MIAVAVISDRSDLYLPACLESLQENLPGVYIPKIIDDRTHDLGMAGAVRAAWGWALDQGCDYLLHWEEDFRSHEPVPLDEMQWVLRTNPHLAQVVLKRQPWNDEEKAAGGIVEASPADYDEVKAWGRNVCWTEHARIFSLNPCLIPRKVLELGWPDDNEAGMTQRCLGAGLRFAFYGPKNGRPLVEHVGTVRGSGWRL